MATLTHIYPPYALQVTAGDLQLRVVRDDDIPELVALAQDGIHDPVSPVRVTRKCLVSIACTPSSSPSRRTVHSKDHVSRVFAARELQ